MCIQDVHTVMADCLCIVMVLISNGKGLIIRSGYMDTSQQHTQLVGKFVFYPSIRGIDVWFALKA